MKNRLIVLKINPQHIIQGTDDDIMTVLIIGFFLIISPHDNSPLIYED